MTEIEPSINILYQFFRKSIANRTPMHARSAAPEKDKVRTVVNEYFRRLKNCSRELLPATVLEVLLTQSVQER